ncbi:MAG: hypothetical protein M3246_04065 [Actinomycetota bacterium]|nr:hypothetical protein [Actinomycetota bacterium]
MKRLVEFPSESGEPVLVEVEDLDPTGGTTRRGLSASAVVERAQTSFEDALEKAQPIASGLIGRLRSMADSPDEVQVEFGLSLSANVGAVLVAGAGAGANYKVTLTWKKASE